MRKNFGILNAIILGTGLTFISACSSSEVKPESSVTAMAVTTTTTTVVPAPSAVWGKTVHFEYDSSDINSESMRILKDDARLLKDNARASVMLEGYCDSRGSEAYNLSLGKRRAEAMRTVLVSEGISPTRLSVLSYGEGRNLSSVQTEQGHALNRRGVISVLPAERVNLLSKVQN